MSELIKRISLGAALASLAFAPLSALAVEEMALTMVIQGVIAPSADGLVVAGGGDTVQALSGNAVTGTLEGEGSVYEGGGYGVIVGNRTSAFKGVPLYLRLKRGTTTYQLLNTGLSPAVVPYTGGAGLAFNVQTLNLVASKTVLTPVGTGSGSSGTGSGTDSYWQRDGGSERRDCDTAAA